MVPMNYLPAKQTIKLVYVAQCINVCEINVKWVSKAVNAND